MTQYIECTECGGGVPWYYAWLNGPDAMHPGCAQDRRNEEGCGAAWFHLSNNGVEAAAEFERLSSSLSEAKADAQRHLQEAVGLKAENDRLREALELTSGALQAGQNSMAPRVGFTGEWSHFGIRSVSEILDLANATLASDPREATQSSHEVHTREHAAAFARWLEDGPRLAKAAGCYVGIKVTRTALGDR